MEKETALLQGKQTCPTLPEEMKVEEKKHHTKCGQLRQMGPQTTSPFHNTKQKTQADRNTRMEILPAPGAWLFAHRGKCLPEQCRVLMVSLLAFGTMSSAFSAIISLICSLEWEWHVVHLKALVFTPLLRKRTWKSTKEGCACVHVCVCTISYKGARTGLPKTSGTMSSKLWRKNFLFHFILWWVYVYV